jgi:LPXTG-motif cell wall-anchored protein
MNLATRLLTAAAIGAGGLLPTLAVGQETPDGGRAPVAQPIADMSTDGPPTAAPPFPGEIGGPYETRQGSYRPVVQQRFQPDASGRVAPNVQQRFPTPDRKGEPPDQKPEQPTPAVPAPSPAPPPSPPMTVAAPPAPAAPQPEETPLPAPRVRRVRLPQTGGDPLTVVGLGVGLTALGLALRRRQAHA